MLKFEYCAKKSKVHYTPYPKFGTVFASHLLRMSLDGSQWDSLTAQILPFQEEPLSPGSSVLHYGQSVFEGMKAFKQENGSIGIFRADLHAQRFESSLQKLVMPVLPSEIFLKCLKEYVSFEQENVPSEKDHALYLRPLMIANDNMVKVSRAKNYIFYIMSCIVGSYFGNGPVKSARVFVNRQFVRSFPGGLGEAKTAANYAASLGPQFFAEGFQCDQVLYLDALHHRYMDELGGMNVFIVKKGELITPPLNGCILNGVTRRSILELAPHLGLKAKEEPIDFLTLAEEVQKGIVTEAFACGTAAVINPIGEFLFQEKYGDSPQSIRFSPPYSTALKILEELQALQRGQKDSSWIYKV